MLLAQCSFNFYIYCATVLTLGLKSRVYGDPYEINDDDEEESFETTLVAIGLLV